MSSITAFAGSVPKNYDRYLGPVLFEPYALDVAERLKNDNLKEVLELACGTGRVTKHLATLIAEEGQLVATDLNADMLALAETNVISSKIKWQVADAQELPFDDNGFDHVVCQFGVMFFPDKQKAFAEAHRVLQPGGKFLFSVWDQLEHNPPIFIIQKVMDAMFGEDAPDFMKKGPHSFFGKVIIKQFLTDAGFQSIHLDVVQKTGVYSSPDDLVTGFVDGSPLSSFLEKHPRSVKSELKQKLHEELTAEVERYGKQVPLQAIVVEAVK
jgi:ubiquinone/menaquinone biosynthesis C-methylase UbiE